MTLQLSFQYKNLFALQDKRQILNQDNKLYLVAYSDLRESKKIPRNRISEVLRYMNELRYSFLT